MQYLYPLLLLFILATSCQDQKNNPDKKPNVIMIYMDDMGYGDLSSYGHPTIETPHLDRLAREGQRWTNFYTASSVCSPSRGALLTGRYPIRIGLAGEDQRVFFPESIGGLPTREVTIAEMLKTEGYAAACIGKWHLGHLPEYLPTNQGFDSYFGIPYSNDMDGVAEKGGWSIKNLLGKPDISIWNVPLMRNDSIIERPANQHTITQRYTEEALQFIESNKDDPFFLYLPHSMVHTPLFAGEDYLNTSSRGMYGDVMKEVDWSVGQIVSKLESLNIDEETMIIFSSDNGPWLIMFEHGGSAGLLKDGKGTTWEGGMRVPGIFYMPGTIAPGDVHGMGSTLDILPTIAALTGADLPKDKILDGYNLMPVLQNKSESPRDHFFYYRKKEIFAARKGDYKAHYITQTAYWPGNKPTIHDTVEVYNVMVDPSEKYNRSERWPEVITEINELVAAHKATVVEVDAEMDKYPDE